MHSRNHERVYEILVLAILVLVTASPRIALGATFSAEGNAIRISGDISPGDDQRFLDLWARGFSEVRIISGGGDVASAISIGEAIARAQPTIIVEGPCLSACANYIFLVSRSRHVLQNGIVCFHGGAPRTPEELKQTVMANVRRGAVPEDKVESIVASSWAFIAGIKPRQSKLLQAGGADEQLLYDDGEMVMPGEISARLSAMPSELAREKRPFWCPRPEVFALYGVTGQWDWYPNSDLRLFDYGQRFSPNLVLLTRTIAQRTRAK